jgi:hypothetical protein
MKNSKIFHFHIYKTGGTAFRNYLVSQCGEAQVSPPLAGIELCSALQRWHHANVISGHFHVHQGDELPTDRLNITFVREPIDRFLSEFFFAKHNNDNSIIDIKYRVLDLNDIIALKNKEGHVSLQINELYPFSASFEEQLSDEQKLLAGKKTIDKFDMIGIQEELEDLASMLAARMSWPNRPLNRANITRKRLSVAELDKAQRRALETLLEPEIELYHYARERFRIDRRRMIRYSSVLNTKEENSPVVALENGTGSIQKKKENKNFGDKRCEILSVNVKGDISESNRVLAGEKIEIKILFNVKEFVDIVVIGFAIKDESNSLMYATNSYNLGYSYEFGAGSYTCSFFFTNRLNVGHYSIDVALTHTNSHHNGCYHWQEKAADLIVYDKMSNHYEGRFIIDTHHHVKSVSKEIDFKEVKNYLLDTIISFGRNNFPLNEFNASLTLMQPIDILQSNVDFLLSIRIENTSKETWCAIGRNKLVNLTYRWYTDQNKIIIADGLRTSLPCDVEPGSSLIIPMRIRSLNQKGKYRLVISLVQESVAWFVERNPKSACILDVELH